MTISERIAELREYARQDSERFTVGQPLSYPHQECERSRAKFLFRTVFFLRHLLMRWFLPGRLGWSTPGRVPF